MIPRLLNVRFNVSLHSWHCQIWPRRWLFVKERVHVYDVPHIVCHGVFVYRLSAIALLCPLLFVYFVLAAAALQQGGAAGKSVCDGAGAGAIGDSSRNGDV